MSTFFHATRRFAALWGFAVFCVLVVILFHRVVKPFVLAIMLAYVLAPSVTFLTRFRIGGRRLPRGVAVIVCYVGILGSFGLFSGAMLPRLSGDFARLFREAPQFFHRVKSDYAPRVSAWIEQSFPSDPDESRLEGPHPERKIAITEVTPGRYDVSLDGLDLQLEPTGKGRYLLRPHQESESNGRLADLMSRLARSSESEAMEVLKLGQRFVAGLVKAVASLILILMVAAFILIDSERLMDFLRGLVPAQSRLQYDEVMVEIDRGLSGVIRGQFAICLINGMLTYVGLLILHVKYPLLLGMLAGAMSIVPVFGSVFSSIPIVTVGLVSGGALNFGRGLAVLGWIVGIHLLEANYLNPKIIGHSAKIHPVLVVFALLVGENIGGFLGALLAVPVVSMVQVLFVYFRRLSDERQALGVP